MITHEEARKYAHNIITEDTTMKHHRSARELYGYANQQEKVGELLFAYQNMFKEIQQLYYYAVYSNDNLTYYIQEIIEKHSEQIQQLEKELNL